MIETFQAWYENPQEYARHWKEKTGGKILGVFGTWGPEEILAAADILPFHIPDNRPEMVAEAPDFLDGIIAPATGRAAAAPATAAPLSYRYALSPLPDRQDPGAQALLAAQLAAFQKSLADWTGKEIGLADLDRGIAILNEHRRLLRSVWETRKKDPPSLTGLEAWYLSGSGQMVDKRDHNRALGEVLEKELPGRRLPVGGRTRLMVLGGEARAAEGLRLVESLEAVVVIDDLESGTRSFWNEVNPAENRLAAIAASTLDRPRPGHPDHVLQLARGWRVQGALILPGSDRTAPPGDLAALRRALDGSGVPSLVLEPDDDTPLRRLKIRIEAFLESLRPEDLF